MSSIPDIESQSARVTLLSAVVVVGGFARLYGTLIDGWPDASMIFALFMELGVVPALWLWQQRIAHKFARYPYPIR